MVHRMNFIDRRLLFVNRMFLDLNGHWFILFGQDLPSRGGQAGFQDFLVKQQGRIPCHFSLIPDK